MQQQEAANFCLGRWLSTPPPGEEVVISGISGRFPNSNNVREFRDNLFHQKSMLGETTKRWTVKHPEIPTKGGLIPDISKFDPGYFGLHYRQAKNMDPTIRNFLEVAVEAIMDAGIHPSELEGSKTGVFIGYSWSDIDCMFLKKINERQTFAMTGYSRNVLAHRLSYHLKLKGPAFILDTACSSSLNALDHAFRAIRTGQCDSALVGGCSLTLHPGCTLQFSRYGVLSKKGLCRVFDEDADGYVRSETITCILLQKAKDSKRIYSQIIYTKINDDGFKNEGISFPSTTSQQQLLTEMYNESGISPSQLSYLELHGTATKAGDIPETCAVDGAIAAQRQKPLSIGSVKSNMGHSEPASGMASLVKLIIAMEEGYIPANLHLKKIKSGMTALEEGRLKVVTETTPLDDENTIFGINNFGFGGNNCHLIFKRAMKKIKSSEDDVPRLVCVSGRTQKSVTAIIDDITQRPLNTEYIALYHQLFKKNFPNHLYRGYVIISKKGCQQSSVKLLKSHSPSNQFINFGKLESSYKRIGQYFLQFPVFQNTIHRINNALSNKNVNIIDIIQKETTKIDEDLLGEVSVHLGIVDTLKALELNLKSTWEDPLGKIISGYYENTITLKEIMQNITNQLVCKDQKKPKTKRLEDYLPKIYSEISKFSKGSNSVLDISDCNEDPSTFLQVVGKLYQEGYNPQLHNLYAKVDFPVSRNTPMISPLIQWNHDKIWYDTVFTNISAAATDMQYSINLAEEYKYIEGHVIDGRNLFPATGYLNIVWELIARERFVQRKHLPIVFENCRFVRATTMSKTGFVSFAVSIQKHNGSFEILENESVVVTGRVYIPEDIKLYQTELPKKEINTETLDEQEIYKELHLRGYNYSGFFKGIVKCNIDASAALVRWENNWVSFMDKMLQIKILQMDSRLLYVPTCLEKLSIDPLQHMELIESLNCEEINLPVFSHKECNIIKSGGIEICGLQANPISRRKPTLEPVLEKNIFVPNDTSLDLAQSVRVNTQLILEETLENKFKALEIVDEYSEPSSSTLMPLISNALEDVPVVHPDLTISSKDIIEDSPGVKVETTTLSSSSNLLLIVASKILQRSTFLNQILSALSPHGYALSREDKDFDPIGLQGVTILTQHTTQDEKLILFKKTEPRKAKTFVKISSKTFDWIPELQKALGNKSDIVVYSQYEETEGILGFVKCIRKEPGGHRISCFFIMEDAPKFDPEDAFYQHEVVKNRAFNFYKNSQWGTYPHLRLDDSFENFAEHAYVSVTSKGNLSSVRWVEGPLSCNKNNQNIIHTYYCALNFKDIMQATGRINIETQRIDQENIVGFEYSGKDVKGNRVMGLITSGSLSTLVAADPNLLWPVPNDWSLKEAATVPAVYSTVIYGLLMRNTLKPGTSILIHSATGGIGIAALNIALHFGCQIFVTVGTQEKRDFLKKHFPQIPSNHIGNSRDTSFEETIKNETRGCGVDMVLNSLAEEKLKASIRCLSKGGKLIEIGKFDLLNNNALNLLLLEKEISYHGVMLDRLFVETKEVKKQLFERLCEGIEKGYVKPLPTTVFQHHEVEAAFKFMMTGKHIGKILVQIQDEKMPPQKVLLKSCPRFYADPNKCYLIIGGLGGFGLELADWLVLRGCRKLVLSSRTGIQNGYQSQRIKVWRSYGTLVHISTISISSKADCINLIKEANQFGQLDGIFNLAVVLEDASFEDQNEEKFSVSLTPKAFATKYLDEVTRDMCPNLQHFVVFSSVSCGRGNPGQTNYGMANSVMERICEKRKRDGFAALAIQWGAIGDVGLVAKMQKDNKELVIGGTLQQKISSCLEVMDKLLKQTSPVVSSMVVAEKRDKRVGSGSAVDSVANILGIKDLKTISLHSTLAEMGMDSMMGTEIIQLLEKDFEIYITAKDVRNLTFTRLIELEAEKNSTFKSEATKKVKGSNTLIQYIPDSKLDDQVIVRLQSKGKECHQAPKIFVLPGVEGVLKLLEPFTQNLNAHVFGIQYSYRNPEDSIQDIAAKVLPHIENELVKKEFYFVGYSFGVTVALELASLLEQKGYNGKIVAIDGSPHYAKKSILQYAPGETEAEFETMLLYNILANFLPIDLLSEHKDKLLGCSNFDERIEVATSLIPSDLPNIDKLEKQAAVTLHKRFKAILGYRFNNNKIKSSVKLYKSTYPLVGDMESDYRLSEFCENVGIMEVEGSHVTILEQQSLVEDVDKIFK